MTAHRPQTLTDLARALQAREVSAESVTERCLDAIRAQDGSTNAFITVFDVAAREAARAVDREIAAGRYRGALHGVPVSLKDLIDVEGTPTTAASKVRSGHVAAADAPIVSRLREAGAVLVGKTNLHEFALGTTNEESAYGAVRHPLDPTRSPGGSSGGSAASVLAGMAYASIGTDTGGSIRIPSAACGLVGLKPAYGDVPTAGVVPLSTTLDHVGPLCLSVADAATVFEVISGAGPKPMPPPAPARGVRLGVPRAYFLDLLDPEVARTFDDTCVRLAAQGVILDEVTIPHAAEIGAVYLHIALPEAAAYHARTLDERGADYTPNVRLRLEAGRYLLAEDYVRAMHGRDVLRDEVDAALAGRDGLLLPSLAVPATPLGAASVRVGSSDEPVRAITLRMTQLFNITGHAALTMPCGATGGGLPIGAQVVGPGTGPVLHLARALEPHVRPSPGASAG